MTQIKGITLIALIFVSSLCSGCKSAKERAKIKREVWVENYICGYHSFPYFRDDEDAKIAIELPENKKLRKYAEKGFHAGRNDAKKGRPDNPYAKHHNEGWR